MSFASVFGDILHVLLALNAIVFAVTVFLDPPFLDPLWKEYHGYCSLVPDKDAPEDPFPLTSHTLCFWVDLVFAGILQILVTLLQNERGMESPTTFLVQDQHCIVLLAVHGIYHGLYAAALRWGISIHNNLLVSVYLPTIFYLVYTWKQLQTIRSSSESHPLQVVVVQPPILEYALFPLLVETPLAVIAWMESTQCASWVSRVWGHVVWDAWAALSLILFYMICWVKAVITEAPSGGAKKTKAS